ncbi:LysR family transcriptional regulator [Paracoccus sp. SM22M-07]|uniref:LysR family transcriptional regulator n=1 Tax=Paracoccus sp. SM22M-07 TaxID=1520813 RepID=UPI0009213636|nr:LysR family transcriptional regulator [Paracoccus sp. SM22M-07]OJH44226.1 LysR family transcriptional regulator [Paracoccus sp. SM22M-07]
MTRHPHPRSLDPQRLVNDLDWNLLRSFVVIVQAGGISKAAEVMNLTQPTVSAALKRLEDRLGRRLIDRGPTVFALTEAGERLYAEAVEIRGSVLRLATILRDVTDAIKGHVRLAIASHVISPLLDDCVRDFHKACPLATLEIEVMASRQVQARLADSAVSVGICLALNRQERLEYRRLFSEYFGIFCGRSHHLYGQQDIGPEALRGESSVSFVTDQMSDALRPVTVMRARLGLSDRLVGSSPNLEEVRRMISAGLGVGPLPVHVARPDVEAGVLWRLPPYDQLPRIDVNVAWNPKARMNRAEQAFLDLLLKKIADTPDALRDYRA